MQMRNDKSQIMIRFEYILSAIEEALPEMLYFASNARIDTLEYTEIMIIKLCSNEKY